MKHVPVVLVMIAAVFGATSPSASAQVPSAPSDWCFGVTHFPDDPIGDAPSRADLALTLDPMLAGQQLLIATDHPVPDGTVSAGSGTIADDGAVSVGLPLYSYGPLALTAAVVVEAGRQVDPLDAATLAGPDVVVIDVSGVGPLEVDAQEPVCSTASLARATTTTSSSSTSTSTSTTTLATSAPAPVTTTPATTQPGTGSTTGGGGSSTGTREFPWAPVGLLILAPALIGGGVFFSKYRRQGWNYTLRVEEWTSIEEPKGSFPWYTGFSSILETGIVPWAIDLDLECRLYIVLRLVRNGVPETSHLTVQINGDQKVGTTSAAPGAKSAGLKITRDLHKEFDADQLKQLRSNKNSALNPFDGKWLEFDFAKKERTVVVQRPVLLESDQEAEVHGQLIYAVAVFAERAKATSELWTKVWSEVDGAAAAGITALSSAAGAGFTAEGGPVAGMAASKATRTALETLYSSTKKGLESQPIAFIMPVLSSYSGKKIPLLDPRPPTPGSTGRRNMVAPGLRIASDEDFTVSDNDAPIQFEAADTIYPESFENYPEPPDDLDYWQLWLRWRANLYIVRG